MKQEIEQVIKVLLKQVEESATADDALKFSQALLNIANAANALAVGELSTRGF